jgi:Tol biopolymer transport system component
VAERGNSAALTADGRTGVFWAHRPDLVPRDSRAYLDLFLYDRRARAIRPLTIGRRDGRRMLGTTGIPAISADGRWLAFASDSAALVRGDTNERSDVFLHGPLRGAGARR